MTRNENDRIREALIALLKFGLEDGSAIAPGFNETKEQALTWLEKQGEPNPYSGVSFNYNGHTWGMCARDNGVEILEDIKKAKQIFLTEGARFMCHCFRKVNPRKYNTMADIRKIIPEFKPTTFLININSDEDFSAWWPITDRESRIKAFDKLIEIYRK